ncbi:hypothetical protein R1sor_003749 [Riccia sorocarpa]|uniref:Dual specificity protein phosphatase 1 n=1 Tax=Riccia sorocarpa TaxID=122646 RepID=A0ABD3H2I4_9MARC
MNAQRNDRRSCLTVFTCEFLQIPKEAVKDSLVCSKNLSMMHEKIGVDLSVLEDGKSTVVSSELEQLVLVTEEELRGFLSERRSETAADWIGVVYSRGVVREVVKKFERIFEHGRDCGGSGHRAEQWGAVAVEDFNKQKMAKILRAFRVAKYVRNDSVPAELEQGLYLGSVGAAFNKGLLQNLNVTHILAVAGGVDMRFPRDFKYIRIEVLDSAEVDLPQHFDRCFAFIDEARMNGGAVLVHCFAGRSRSVTVAVAYLMKKYGMRFPQALAHVTSRRKRAQPNPGFLRQLQEFDQQLELARKSFPAETSQR